MDAVHSSRFDAQPAGVVAELTRPIAVTAGVAAIVTAANGAQGAYFSQSWGWVALAFLVPTALTLILAGPRAIDRFSLAFLGLVLTVASWTALSSLWSESTPGSLREVERMVVYVGLALAVALVLRAGDAPPVVAGLVVATSLICGYALATRLLPDRLVTHDDPSLENRLAQPLGYPNGLGALSAVGILLAVGIVAHGSRKAATATAFGLPIMVGALYFSFSRGAWAALAVSCVVGLVLDKRWLRSLWLVGFVSLPSIAFLLLASRQVALTSAAVDRERAALEGHRLALILVVVVILSALLAWIAHLVARRIVVPERMTQLARAIVVCGALAAAIVGLVAVGGPAEGASRLRESFETFHSGATTDDLNSRLFKVYGTGRAEIWPVAWNGFKRSPVIGNGAGSFEYSWYVERPTARITRDAHSIYLESLDELGLIGFCLVVAMLVVPLAAIAVRRRSPYVAYAGAAYVSWAASCAVDWHWEMTGLSVTALLAGSVAFMAKPDEGSTVRAIPRAPFLGLTVVLTVLAVVSLVGNQALFASREALARGQWSDAKRDARIAARLLPWSFEPDIALGDAEARLGDRQATLRAYRDATRKDPRNWSAWLRLAQVARGAERADAYARVHVLNPREPELPGERRAAG